MPATADTLRDAASASDTLVENLAALWAVDPVLAEQLDALNDSDLLPTEATRTGLPTLVLPQSNGKPLALHSRYNPEEEADRLVSRLQDDRHVLFVLGMGLGYHLLSIRKRFEGAAVWVFEPDLRVIRAAIATRDFSKSILDKTLRIIHRAEKASLFAEWMPNLAAMSMGHQIVDHPPSVQLYEQYFGQVRLLVEEFLAFGKTTINTLLVNSKRTCENLAQNIPWYVASPGVGRLKGTMQGKPAIIVAAGPSLRKNKHLLPGAVGKAVIISVQTAFQQLLDIGVEPHFVTSLDYHDICTQFFEKVPPTVRTELIAEPKATPKVFELNPGPTSLLGNDFIERLLCEMKPDRAKLPAGATVAHLAYYAAEYLGCNPIIFVGQDLGFSEGLAYAPGTSYDDLWRPELGRFNTVEMMQWQRIVRDRAILRRVPDYRGGTTYTEDRLFTYLQQFERDFLNSDRTIIDATEGGVAKRGTTVMTLAEALDRHCREPLGSSVPAHPGLDWSRLGAAAKSLANRQSEAARVRTISEETLPLLTEIRDSLDNQVRVNQLIAKIDPLRAGMNELGATYDLITQLTQQSELDRFAADRRIAAAGLDGVERQKRQLDRDIANVRHMISAAEEFESLMIRCIGIIHACADRKGGLA